MNTPAPLRWTPLARFGIVAGLGLSLAACAGDEGDDVIVESEDTGSETLDNCEPITVGAVARAIGNGQVGVYVAPISPDAGDADDQDELELQFFGDFPEIAVDGNGEQTGTFDLGDDEHGNYQSSSRSLLVVEDPDAPTYFYQSSGTLVVDDGSTPLEGNTSFRATLTDVTLIESEIDFGGTFLSTPVEGGRCLRIDTATLEYEPGENQLANSGFESFTAGPNDVPTDWLPFGATINPFADVGYSAFGTVAHDAVVDGSTRFDGRGTTRGLVTRGVEADRGGMLANSLGTVFQSFDDVVPGDATLTLSGWAYVSSAEPLDPDTSGYLFIKCFSADFSAEYCAAGRGAQSLLVTSDTPTDTWIRFSTSVRSLNPLTSIVQAGVEFEQCATGDCATGNGAVYWDDLNLTWE